MEHIYNAYYTFIQNNAQNIKHFKAINYPSAPSILLCVIRFEINTNLPNIVHFCLTTLYYSCIIKAPSHIVKNENLVKNDFSFRSMTKEHVLP